MAYRPRAALRRWQYFLSHNQKNSGDQCHVLFFILKHALIHSWYDMKADNLTTDGMMEGVAQSEVFLLFANDMTLSRWFVHKEWARALSLKKRIVVVLEMDPNHGARLLPTGDCDLKAVFLDQPLEARNGTWTDKPVSEAQIRDFYAGVSSGAVPVLPFGRGPAESRALLTKLATIVGVSFPLLPPPPPSAAVAAGGGGGGGGTVHITYNAVNSHDQASIIKYSLEEEEYGLAVTMDEPDAKLSRAATAVAAARALVVVLNAGTMGCANVQKAVQATLNSEKKIILVHEMDGRHGAPLNDDGGFDFGLVFRDAPNQELKTLASNIESIPFHRRGKLFQVTVDSIAEQVSGRQAGTRAAVPSQQQTRAQRKQHLIASLNEIKEEQLKLGEQIGRGGFGDVFAATYKKRTAVAVKMIGAALRGANQSVIDGMLEEAAMLHSLSHPNVVRLHGVNQTTMPCLVLEMLNGGSLFDLLHRVPEGTPPLPLSWVVCLMKDVAEAIEYLHAVPMAHRDLKSMNIMLRVGDTDGSVEPVLIGA